MEAIPRPTFISFDWDEFDTTSSKTENSDYSYGFSFSDLESNDDKNESDFLAKFNKDKQLQNSYSSTTTRDKTRISEEIESVHPKKKSRKAKKT
jgi:hypothetical protein